MRLKELILITLFFTLQVIAAVDRPAQEVVVSPYPEGVMAVINSSSMYKALIITYGAGPITGYTPWQDKDYWIYILQKLGT